MHATILGIRDLCDLLRGRVTQYRGKRNTRTLAGEIGIDERVLMRFLRGGGMKTSQLQLLETWCGCEAAAREATPTPPA